MAKEVADVEPSWATPFTELLALGVQGEFRCLQDELGAIVRLLDARSHVRVQAGSWLRVSAHRDGVL